MKKFKNAGILGIVILVFFSYCATRKYMNKMLPKDSCITIQTKNDNYYYIHKSSEVKNHEEYSYLQYKIDTTPQNEYIYFTDNNGNKVKLLNSDIKKMYYIILKK